MLRTRTLLLVALVAPACAGGSGFGGLAGEKHQQTHAKDAATSAEDSSDPDEETAAATQPVQVAGAFLTLSCGVDTAPTEGCGFFDGKGEKAASQPKIKAVKLAYDDGSDADAALTPAPDDSRWQTLFPVDATKTLKSFSVTYQDGGTSRTSAVEAPAAPQAAAGCQANELKAPQGTVCEKVTKLDYYQHINSGGGATDIVYVPETNDAAYQQDTARITAAGYTLGGIGLTGVLPPQSCDFTHNCPQTDQLPDGSVPIYRLVSPQGIHIWSTHTEAVQLVGANWTPERMIMRLAPANPADPSPDRGLWRVRNDSSGSFVLVAKPVLPSYTGAPWGTPTLIGVLP